MFICEDCIKKYYVFLDLRFRLFRSQGPCENCHETKPCYDIYHDLLILKKKEPVLERSAKLLEKGRKLMKRVDRILADEPLNIVQALILLHLYLDQNKEPTPKIDKLFQSLKRKFKEKDSRLKIHKSIEEALKDKRIILPPRKTLEDELNTPCPTCGRPPSRWK